MRFFFTNPLKQGNFQSYYFKDIHEIKEQTNGLLIDMNDFVRTDYKTQKYRHHLYVVQDTPALARVLNQKRLPFRLVKGN
ncbi:MAG: hypothetical protein HC913_13465 [Microscillaceae bacterium]|nr:hypothetical protein [Microscillaceae bacterium]